MKKILLITIVILILGVAVPVSAKGREFAGEWLNLWIEEQEYPAGEPFFVMHGWGNMPQVPPTGMVGLFKFELEMDGQPLRQDYIMTIPYPPDQPLWIDRYWVYNFPEGLTGDHIFTLRYFGACVAFGGYEYCPPPYRNEVLEVATYTAVVHFIP